jgi:hypothetical protein
MSPERASAKWGKKKKHPNSGPQCAAANWQRRFKPDINGMRDSKRRWRRVNIAESIKRGNRSRFRA